MIVHYDRLELLYRVTCECQIATFRKRCVALRCMMCVKELRCEKKDVCERKAIMLLVNVGTSPILSLSLLLVVLHVSCSLRRRRNHTCQLAPCIFSFHQFCFVCFTLIGQLRFVMTCAPVVSSISRQFSVLVLVCSCNACNACSRAI